MRRAASEPLPGAPDPWAPSEMPPFRSRPPYVMSDMIAGEPAIAERLVRRLRSHDVLGELASMLTDAATSGRPVLTTGLGTSEHAAMGIAVLLNDALGPGARTVGCVPALELVQHPLGEGLLIAVSHEGGTLVTNEALRAARDAGARTALITVSDRSPGAELAELVVTTEEQDQSWCHTVGYLSPLLVGTLLAARLQKRRPDGAALRALLDVADDPHASAAIAAALAGTDRLLVVGSAHDHVTARELALKVAEGARLASAAHELETVLHGHLAAVNRWTGLVLVLTELGSPLVAERARKVLAAAKSIGVPAAGIVSESVDAEMRAAPTPAGRIVLPRTGRVPSLAGSMLASAVALQRLTERLARARNVDPDTLGREDPGQAAAHA